MNTTGEPYRVLLVDDDDTFREVMASELARRGHEIVAAANGREALERAEDVKVAVILLDLCLPDLDGIEVLKRLREREVAAGVVVLTGHGTIDTAIRAIRLGAHDYLEKPCPVEKVEMAIVKTRENLVLRQRKQILQDGYVLPDIGTEFVGESAQLEKLRSIVARVGAADSTTLIQGETGTGKEMVAMLLHGASSRREAPFVVVDCAALHEDLLQSELFGHEKGAFTSATRRKHGLCEVADGGTLFLDEVADTSSDIQAKLLRVLETGRFRRLGGTREIAVDVRVISATNRDLRKAIAKRQFREDLYFRLATVTIEVPPLREHKEDIPLLVEHFTRRFNRRFSLSCSFSDAAIQALIRHPWAGNVRELIHVVEQAMVLTDSDVIGPEGLPDHVLSRATEPSTGAGSDPVALRDVERRHVLAVMKQMDGNRARAARALGISERNLYRMLKRYEEHPESAAPSEAKGGPD